MKVGDIIKFVRDLEAKVGSDTEYHITNIEPTRIRVSWVIEEMENGWDSQWVHRTGVEQLITEGKVTVINKGPKFSMTHKFI